MTLSVESTRSLSLIIDEQASKNLQLKPDFSWFEPHFWQSQNAVVKTAQGRGVTYFVKQGNSTLVLRHYRRGGMIRHLSTDSFVYTGLHKTRPWQELSLLNSMNRLGLPVPAGLAGRVVRTGIWYQADILTLCIAESEDVHSLLCHRTLADDDWVNIGKTIRALHDQQVYHHDLNIHNILQDSSKKLWVIDFDKCAQRNGDNWKQDNLQRLKRSLHKESHRNQGYYFNDSNWQALLDGYSH